MDIERARIRLECAKLAVVLAAPNRDVEVVASLLERLYGAVVNGPVETPATGPETGSVKPRGKDKPAATDPFA